MHVGIIGLPSSGKTTVFQALTSADSPGMRAGGKGDTRIVPVPDARLHILAAMYHPRKVTPATIEFVDPLVTGQQRRALCREPLVAHARCRCAGARRARLSESCGAPCRTAASMRYGIFMQLNSELLLADLAVVEKRLRASRKGCEKNQKS